jgi:hypothetical protein
MFKYKTEEDLSKMTAEQRDIYAEQKRDFEAGQTKQMIADAIKERFPEKTKEEADKEAEAAKAEAAKRDELYNTVQELKERGTPSENTSKAVAQELKANMDKIKGLAKGTEKEDVVVKALTLRSAITNNQSAYDLPDIGQIATRKLSLYDIFPKLRLSKGTHSGTIRYYDWDEETIARAAAAVAEGAAFPQSTATFKKYSIELQKVGDTLPVTEEFFEDEVLFAAELEMFLDINVKLEIDRQLAEADGTGNTIVGIKNAVTAYTATAAGITDANIYDLIVKMSEKITVAGGSRFSPDVVIASQAVINQMRLKKDANNNYVLPPFVSRDGNNIAGMTVIASDIFGSNELVVGDRRFAKIYELGGVTLSKGMIGNQFTEDEMTLKARKRLALLVRNCDKGAFRYCSNITTALSTLATAP